MSDSIQTVRWLLMGERRTGRSEMGQAQKGRKEWTSSSSSSDGGQLQVLGVEEKEK